MLETIVHKKIGNNIDIIILKDADSNEKQVNISIKKTLAGAHVERPHEQVHILPFIVRLSSGYAWPIIDVEVANN